MCCSLTHGNDGTPLPKEGDTILATLFWQSVHLLFEVGAVQATQGESPFKYILVSIAGLLPKHVHPYTRLVNSHHFNQSLPLAMTTQRKLPWDFLRA